MLFSLFFGAGNLIFPPELGQSAGSNAWPAIIGFLISGVGLPILGVMAITYVGSDDAEGLGRRVHPYFAIGFTALTFLTIGPFFLRFLVRERYPMKLVFFHLLKEVRALMHLVRYGCFFSQLHTLLSYFIYH